MQDSTGSKAIKVTPEELVFDHLTPNVEQTQELVFKNNLSAPVDITLKTSNFERLQIEPKQKRLAPFESFTAEVTAKVAKLQNGHKAPRYKEVIRITSDYFDYKVNVSLIPTNLPIMVSGQGHSTSVESISRGRGQELVDQPSKSSLVQKKSSTRQIQKEDKSPLRLQQSSPLQRDVLQLNRLQASVSNNLNYDTETRELMIEELTQQVKVAEDKLRAAEFQNEQSKSRILELESSERVYMSDTNTKYLDDVRILLRDREPNLEKLMDITLKKERDAQESKDSKVLAILKSKDVRIEELEQRTVQQEADYGKLAQAFQDQKRSLRNMEDQEQQMSQALADLEAQLENMRGKLSSYESGKEFRRLIESEEHLRDAQSFIEQIEADLAVERDSVNQKENLIIFLQEAIQRQKDQVVQKDSKIQELERLYENEKERRIREEEHSRILNDQLKSGSGSTILSVDRIDTLQNEKGDLLKQVQSLLSEKQSLEDKLRQQIDRITDFRPLSQVQTSQQRSVIDNLSSKLNDLINFSRETYDENLTLVDAVKDLKGLLTQKDSEIQVLLSDNKQLSHQVHGMVTKKSLARAVQTEIEREDMEIYDELKDKCSNLEDEIDSFNKKIREKDRKMAQIQGELDAKTQEVNILIKQGASAYTPNASVTSSQQQPNEDLLAKLNARISQLKSNEDLLIQELSKLRQQQTATNPSVDTNHRTSSNSNPLEGKMIEYEAIVFEQSERMIKLEEENAHLRRQIKDITIKNAQQSEQAQIRIKNLQEINQKHESLSIERDSLQDIKSLQKPGDMERLRQITQQTQLQNMTLKHQNEELRVDLMQREAESKRYRDELSNVETVLIKMKQDAKLSDSGFREPIGRDPNLQQKVIEQRNQIKHLQGLLIRAKQDFDQQSKNNNHQDGQQEGYNTLINSSSSMLRFEELNKTNERLRKEHHQAIMALIDLKDEYSSKLHIIHEKHDHLRGKLIKENQSLQRTLESLQVQIQHMESKEVRLFGHLEEAKALQVRESQEKEQRTQELEELIFKKESTIADLEREIRTKEKTLMERQEQISVLIATLEGESSRDELKQKLLNLSAELCSIKAIESQQVRKLNDMNLNLKKAELAANKNLKALDQTKLQLKDTNAFLQNLQQQNTLLERRIQDLNMQLDDKTREATDLKYRIEKDDFQLKLKDENIQQAREQLRRSEQMFKEEVERLKKEFFDQITKEYETNKNGGQLQSNENEKTTIKFKTILKQIHVLLCDYLTSQKSADSEDKALFKEFERALQVASQTIEKLQGDLDKSSFLASRFKQDLKACALNKVLLSRQEQLQIRLHKQQLLLIQREQERASFFKHQEISFIKLNREQELKIQHLERENKDIDEENSQLKEELRQARDQKDEIEQNLVLFEQEIQSKRQAMEKQAELSVDERFKTKHESIKCYFDSQLTKILIGSQLSSNNERVLEMGREILALKLLVQKLESQIVYEQSESQSLELNLAHYKEQVASLEQRVRDLSVKNTQMSKRVRQNEISQRMEVEKKKQDINALEKELIKAREVSEQKSREIINNQDSTYQAEQNIPNDKVSSINDIQSAEKDYTIKTLSTQVEDLQEKLLDIRSSHIQELDLLRVQYDSDLAESKLQLSKERELLEKRFLPGHAPGDIQLENQELVRRIQELRGSLDQILHENVILKKRFENENALADTLRREVESYKQALVDLEQTMIDMGSNSAAQQNHQHLGSVARIAQAERDRSSSRGREKATETKSRKSQSKNPKKSLQMNRDQTNQSIAHPIDETSLMTSVITENVQFTARAQQVKNFIAVPSALVKALVQSKIQELTILKKYDDQLQIELELRHSLKEAHLKELKGNSSSDLAIEKLNNYSNESNQLQRRVLELQIEIEDLKLQRAHEQVDQIQLRASHYQPSQNLDRIDFAVRDYNLLIDSVINLSQQIGMLESGLSQKESSTVLPDGNQRSVEEAQRLVIKALVMKVNQSGYNSIFDNQSHYQPPSEEQDRKLWYLELLESQVSASESVMNNLQSFIKKLQIDVQGNLQSAASIKSASMDLANNLKRTSEEVKTLKHVVSLAKHDLAKLTFNSNTTLNNNATRTINPFTQQEALQASIKGGALLSTGNSQNLYNQLMSQQDHLQNQLTITEKVKKSLEQELVSIKIAHQQEVSSLNQRLTQALDQRNSMLQSNEELHDRVEKLQLKLDEIKQETIKLGEENAQAQALMIEKEREKQLMAQNKTATSKHLSKLQADMQDWRRQTDDNMKIKEKQIDELQSQLTSLQKERDRLKSENQMLRRVDKDRRAGETDDYRKLQDENQELSLRLEEQIQERKREIEYWVNERATMREMIEQLENEKVNGTEGPGAATVLPNEMLINPAEGDIQKIKKKAYKKLKEKDLEIKSKQKLIEDLRDEVHRVKQEQTQLEQRLRESEVDQQEHEDRLKYQNQRLKEVELERDLVLAEKNNAISTNDITAQQIQVELNSLRECFAKLKIERDNLLFEIESTSSREREWRSTVERLSDEVQKLEGQIALRERDQAQQLRSLESRNASLNQELRFTKEESDKLKERLRNLDAQALQQEQKFHTHDLNLQQAIFSQEELRRQVNEARMMVRKREEEISDLQEQLLLNEGQKLRDIEQLQVKMSEVREANSHMNQLFEAQIQDLKLRLISDKKKTEQQADQIVNLAQREAVIKQLKKENITLKAAYVKVKAKNKEMKIQLSTSAEKENLSNTSVANSVSTKHSTARKALGRSANSSRFYQDKDDSQLEQIDKSVIKLAQLLLSNLPTNLETPSDKHLALFDHIQRYSKASSRILELEAELDKCLILEASSRDQLHLLKDENDELLQDIRDLKERAQKETKGTSAMKQATEQLESTKHQLRQAQSELLQLRQEWLPPSEAKSLQDKLREAHSQSKSLKEEIQRKKDVIAQLRAQKEATVTEANQVAADLDNLKDDNAKLQRLIKENTKQLSLVSELRAANDQLRSTERRLREEILSLSERLRVQKQEATRKDTLAKELRDRLEQFQDEVADSRDRNSEIDRLKETIKKLKLENEIKENQVRSLKVKIEHQEGENEQLKQSKRDDQQEQQTEAQLKATRNKLKKTESVVKKALEALRKVGREVALSYQNSSRKFSSITVQKDFNTKPQPEQTFNQDQLHLKQYYKESVNILGMSMDELMDDFVAPKQQQSINSCDSNPNAKIWEQQLLQQADRLNNNNSADGDILDVVDQVCNLCLKLISEITSQTVSVQQSPHIQSNSVKLH